MTSIEVFDPAMCCSTGVPSVASKLARFAADLEWLTGQGAAVARATLSQEPEKFMACSLVREAVSTQGAAALPVVLVDGRLRSTGRYPLRAELARWTGIRQLPQAGTSSKEEVGHD
jgi:hypothetical protein